MPDIYAYFMYPYTSRIPAYTLLVYDNMHLRLCSHTQNIRKNAALNIYVYLYISRSDKGKKYEGNGKEMILIEGI